MDLEGTEDPMAIKPELVLHHLWFWEDSLDPLDFPEEGLGQPSENSPEKDLMRKELLATLLAPTWRQALFQILTLQWQTSPAESVLDWAPL